MDKYYKALGLEYGATKSEIKKAFYKLAKVHHPDKGGNEKKFKEINEAYQHLTSAGYEAMMKKAYGDVNVSPDNEAKRSYGFYTGSKTRAKGRYQFFCTDDGSSYWFEDEDGYVVSYWGKRPYDEPQEEEVDDREPIEGVAYEELAHANV